MKKILIALCAAACLLLAACGETERAGRAFQPQDVDALLTAGVFSDTLEEVDADIVCMLYGLDLDGAVVFDCVGYFSGGASAEELVLFTAVDENAAETVRTACEQRLAAQLLAYEDYLPAEVVKLENAILAVRDNTVLLVVAEDSAAAAQQLEALN